MNIDGGLDPILLDVDGDEPADHRNSNIGTVLARIPDVVELRGNVVVFIVEGITQEVAVDHVDL